MNVLSVQEITLTAADKVWQQMVHTGQWGGGGGCKQGAEPHCSTHGPRTKQHQYPCGAFYLFICLFVFQERGRREKERERSIWEQNIDHVRELPLAHAPTCNPGPQLNLQHRQVAWPGIKPATFCFAGWCPINWVILLRALGSLLKVQNFVPPQSHWIRICILTRLQAMCMHTKA